MIYFHAAGEQQIRLLLMYMKGAKDNLSPLEKRLLRNLNENW